MSTQKFNKLAGKHILIVGGSAGIGYGVAEGCIESNARVSIASSSSSRVEAAVESLKKSYPSCEVAGHVCDLSKPTVESDIEALFEKVGHVDHIVFTAGDRLAMKPIQEASYEGLIKAGQVRFFAALLVAKVGSRYLKKSSDSSIVLTTGSVSDKPRDNWSMIAGYASGLHGMTRNLALDLKPIRVNLVNPGAIDTPLWDWMGDDVKQKMFNALAEKLPTAHVGKPEEVAEAYLWLMKDSNATGVVATSNSGSLLV